MQDTFVVFLSCIQDTFRSFLSYIQDIFFDILQQSDYDTTEKASLLTE